MDSYYRWSICLLERIGINEYIEIILNITGGLMISDKIWRYKIIWGSVHRDMSAVSAGVVSKQGMKNARKSERWRCTAMKAGGGG
jgi:hypothetical protein